MYSAKNKNRGRASPGGGGPHLLRQGLHHQAQVHGGEHRGGAARVHHLEKGGQDAQLRHGTRRHQVGGEGGVQTIRRIVGERTRIEVDAIDSNFDEIKSSGIR